MMAAINGVIYSSSSIFLWALYNSHIRRLARVLDFFMGSYVTQKMRNPQEKNWGRCPTLEVMHLEGVPQGLRLLRLSSARGGTQIQHDNCGQIFWEKNCLEKGLKNLMSFSDIISYEQRVVIPMEPLRDLRVNQYPLKILQQFKL